ncbi:uncharacterized protein MJAP1_001376 [Malassezia japonica]|uniref:Membrane magnesium transporter n=1 Tax=Malassezia japonica TaxID=223818 RepID=A0AAF0F4Z6_9BASI|nr:uncharacterized protein MJAP1_001376 [Malassezia japonica]WFD38423.1 hypothetical protein MJAP1_001376 [Malassezia japonica]
MASELKERPSATGRTLVAVGIVLFVHAAYSTYESVLSQGKSMDLGTASTQYENAIPWDVTFETLLAFAVLTLGCALTTPPLKEIAWATELRSDSIDRVDARPSFANVRHRGAMLFGDK